MLPKQKPTTFREVSAILDSHKRELNGLKNEIVQAATLFNKMYDAINSLKREFDASHPKPYIEPIKEIITEELIYEELPIQSDCVI